MISIETMKFRTADMIGEEFPLVFWRGNGRIVASDDESISLLVRGVRVDLTWDRLTVTWSRFMQNHTMTVDELGGGADAVDYETVTYEGYGPGGVAIICVALTDNRNRTASDVRHAFTKSGSELGTPGSVAWQFERKGVILIDGEGVDEEALMDAALEAGAEDISEDGSQWQVVTDPTELAQVRGNLEGAGFAMASSDITMLPKATVATGEKEAKQLLRLLDDLEENDDVQDVYANFDISEEVMEAVAG